MNWARTGQVGASPLYLSGATRSQSAAPHSNTSARPPAHRQIPIRTNRRRAVARPRTTPKLDLRHVVSPTPFAPSIPRKRPRRPGPRDPGTSDTPHHTAPPAPRRPSTTDARTPRASPPCPASARGGTHGCLSLCSVCAPPCAPRPAPGHHAGCLPHSGQARHLGPGVQ